MTLEVRVGIEWCALGVVKMRGTGRSAAAALTQLHRCAKSCTRRIHQRTHRCTTQMTVSADLHERSTIEIKDVDGWWGIEGTRLLIEATSNRQQGLQKQS